MNITIEIWDSLRNSHSIARKSEHPMQMVIVFIGQAMVHGGAY